MKVEGCDSPHLPFLPSQGWFYNFFLLKLPSVFCCTLFFLDLAYWKQGVGQRFWMLFTLFSLGCISQGELSTTLEKGDQCKALRALPRNVHSLRWGQHWPWQTPVLGPGYVGGMVAWKMKPVIRWLSAFPTISAGGRDQSCSLYFFLLGWDRSVLAPGLQESLH